MKGVRPRVADPDGFGQCADHERGRAVSTGRARHWGSGRLGYGVGSDADTDLEGELDGTADAGGR